MSLPSGWSVLSGSFVGRIRFYTEKALLKLFRLVLSAVNSPIKNVLLLALCQALAMTGNTVFFSTAALIGEALVLDKSQATLPVAVSQIGVMAATIPASLLMKQVGRQWGFVVGVLMGLVGSGLGVYAIFAHSFSWFCTAAVLFGIFNAFVAYYRFAAADAANESLRSRAISWVVAGGVVAALFGPWLAAWSKDFFLEAQFAGSFCIMILLQIFSLFLLGMVQIPQLSVTEQKSGGRPLLQIVRQPVFIVAGLGSMLGYGVMSLVMTATPLSMTHHAFDFDQAAFVIQWHVLGMFMPSFFTGSLITRFGLLTVIMGGGILELLALILNGLTDHSLLVYWVALLCLGLGWNFLYVGSTTLLTEAHTTAEKAKTQATHDFLMFSSVAICTFLSGKLLNTYGWQGVNLVGFPLLLLTLGAALWYRTHRTRQEIASRQV